MRIAWRFFGRFDARGFSPERARAHPREGPSEHFVVSAVTGTLFTLNISFESTDILEKLYFDEGNQTEVSEADSVSESRMWFPLISRVRRRKLRNFHPEKLLRMQLDGVAFDQSERGTFVRRVRY